MDRRKERDQAGEETADSDRSLRPSRFGENYADAGEEDHEGVVRLYRPPEREVRDKQTEGMDRPSAERDGGEGDDQGNQDSVQAAENGEHTEIGLI